MHRFMGEIEEERFLPVSLTLEKINGASRQKRGDVTVLWHSLTIIIDRVLFVWRIILSLTFEAKPVVEARAGIIIARAHMPLADEPRGISYLLQILRKKEGSLGNRTLVINHPVAKRI